VNFVEFWLLAPSIALGGAAGALTRWGTFRAWGESRAAAALLSVNLAGSFALGVFYAVSPGLPSVVVAGLVAFTGGLTTFSTLMVACVRDARARKWGRAVILLVVHVGGGTVCALLGAYAVMLAIGA
jgi:fluoride exporter